MSESAENASRFDDREEKRRARIRSVILSALAASGAFQLSSWQAQAHGNRSSHSTSSLRSDLFLPQDYISFRQQLTAPTAEETLVLSQLRGRMGLLRGSSEAGAETRGEIEALQAQIDAISEKLRLRETSRQTLDFLQQGDVDAAVAVIEGHGDPELVTYEYLWTITDLAYLDSNDGQLTLESSGALAALGKRAVQYMDETRQKIGREERNATEIAVLTRMAEIYHNIASYMVPDVGSPTSDDLSLGKEAAEKAYSLRQELNQQREAVIGLWSVARFEALTGNPLRAAALHKEALSKAQAMGDPVQAAWNIYSIEQLSLAQPGVLSVEDGPSRVEALLSEAGADDPVAALLRLQMQRDRSGG